MQITIIKNNKVLYNRDADTYITQRCLPGPGDSGDMPVLL